MAYNLPPPWSSGYVLPQNVRDEGLQRRAFITKMMPRGTYDDPRVGTGGFQVPQYIRDEGYGQGTFTTKWLPSGTYVGPKVQHWLNQRPVVASVKPLPGGGKVVTMDALGSDDAPMPKVFDDYGQRAAQALISTVSRLPAGQRKTAMKTIMDKVDPSLWKRTQAITKRYMAQGASVTQAFPQALARALSTGVAAEIIDTGLRRSAPQARSLLGLGCYGPSALGRINLQTEEDDGPKPTTAPSTSAGGGLIGGGSTGGAAGGGGRAGTGPVSGGAVVAPSGAIAVTVAGLPFDPATLTRVWSSADRPSVTIANRDAPPDVLIDDPAKIPQETKDFLHEILLRPGTGAPQRGYMSTNPMTGFPEPDATPWFQALGIGGDTLMNMNPLWWLRVAGTPFARVKGVDGRDLVLHIRLAKRDPALPADPSPDGKLTGYTNPLVLKAWLTQVPDPSVWTSVWKGVTAIPMKIATSVITPIVAPVVTPVVNAGIDAAGAVGDAVKEGLDKLGDLACNLMGTPGVGAAAGAAAGAVAGVPPQAGAAAGAAGAQIAQGACGQPPPPPPAPVAPGGISTSTLLLLGGAAAVAAVLLTGKKRTSTP